MKNLAVFPGLSHLHPDPLQGITPQLSTPVGRLQKKKKKHSFMMWGRHQQIFNKETGAGSGDQEETRKEGGEYSGGIQ